jgi:hypothetical protein
MQIPTSIKINTVRPPLGSCANEPKIEFQLAIIQINEGNVTNNCAISHNKALQAVNADALDVLIP